MTALQLEPSAQAPCTNTIFGSVFTSSLPFARSTSTASQRWKRLFLRFLSRNAALPFSHLFVSFVSPTLAVDHAHVGVPLPSGHPLWRNLLNARKILSGKSNPYCGDILLEVVAMLGAGDRHNILAPRQ